MAGRDSFIIVHFVEQQLEGWEFERAHWPLHITLVPWFKVRDEEAVIRSLERIAGESAPLLLGVGEEEMFGVDNNIPVNVITNQFPIMQLHENLMQTLNESDVSYNDKRFMGKEYIAHVTRHVADGRFSNQGEQIAVDQFHLVRLVDDKTCHVVQQFELHRR